MRKQPPTPDNAGPAADEPEHPAGKDAAVLRTLFDALPLSIFVKDRQSNYLFCNRTYAGVLGLSGESMVGRCDYDYFPAELARRYRGDDQRVMNERITLHTEEPFEIDGQPGWISTTKTPWLDEAGGIGGVIGYFADITPHKRAEARYETIIQTSLDAFVLIGSDARLLEVNDATCRLTGYSRDELLAMTLFDIEAQQTREEIESSFEQLIARGGGVFETRWRERGGRHIPVEVSVRMLDEGSGAHFFAFLRDIRERKRIEQALARKTAMYALLSRVNNAIVKTTDARTLFDEICRDAVALGGFALVWIGRVDADGRVRVAACAGTQDCAAYPETIEISVSPDLASGRGATGTAIRENRPVISRHLLQDESAPWHGPAERYGLRSSIALPIAGGDFHGALNIYSRVDDHFDEDICVLVKEVAGDISFALRKISDTEQRERAEAQLELYAQVFGNSSDGMAITDADNKIVAVNQSFVDITGYSREEVLGQNPRLLRSGRHDREFYQEMWYSLIEQGSWQGEIWNRRKNGDLFPEWVTINVVRDRNGRISNHFAVFSDLVQKKAAEELSHLKRFDALTGLPNPVMMEDRISEAIVHARQHGRYVGLLFINIDHFHMVNDLFGHVAGDQVLRQSAQRLVDVVGTHGTVSRFSGDIFVVALPDLNASSEINPLAAALLASIAEPYRVDGQAINLSARIGIAVFPNDGDDFATLMKNADAALLDAKIGGKNSFRFFTARMNEHAQRLLTIGGELRDAMRERRLLLHYQPQVDLGNGRIVGFEALVRIAHPERGLIPPSEFIPIAEENGMINELGNWVIDEACRQRRVWLDAGYGNFVVAINLSALQLAQPGLPAFVAGSLARHGLPGYLIELEFTESALMRRVEQTLALMNEFRALGLRLSIDDFGTGYSSLSYLRQFPLDKLKIDQSFVRNLAARGSDASIVQAVIALARALRLSTIAEGVETEAQRAELQLLGCDEMQGYLFSRPLPATGVTPLLQRAR